MVGNENQNIAKSKLEWVKVPEGILDKAIKEIDLIIDSEKIKVDYIIKSFVLFLLLKNIYTSGYFKDFFSNKKKYYTSLNIKCPKTFTKYLNILIALGLGIKTDNNLQLVSYDKALKLLNVNRRKFYYVKKTSDFKTLLDLIKIEPLYRSFDNQNIQIKRKPDAANSNSNAGKYNNSDNISLSTKSFARKFNKSSHSTGVRYFQKLEKLGMITVKRNRFIVIKENVSDKEYHLFLNSRIGDKRHYFLRWNEICQTLPNDIQIDYKKLEKKSNKVAIPNTTIDSGALKSILEPVSLKKKRTSRPEILFDGGNINDMWYYRMNGYCFYDQIKVDNTIHMEGKIYNSYSLKEVQSPNCNILSPIGWYIKNNIDFEIEDDL